MNTTVDYIIVGQGIAGSSLAIHLLLMDKKIMVIDEPNRNNSSLVAAGLFNPITGQNLTKTWLSDLIFPKLFSFYRQVETLTRSKFFYPLNIYKPFKTIEEQNEWMARSAESLYQPYLQAVSTSAVFNGVRDALGGIVINQSGYINTREYLTAIRQYLQEKESFRSEKFSEDDLITENDFVRYRDLVARKIIFCQGTHVATNKWFGKIPLKALKGETLTIKFPWRKDVILNRGVYIVPTDQPGEYKVGATYNFHDNFHGTTSEGYQELTEKLNDLVSLDYDVISHDWGMRPTTHDRKPILGVHPKNPNLAIFNGLGTKGVSLAPYFSEVLIHWLEKGGQIDKAVDVTRFKSLY